MGGTGWWRQHRNIPHGGRGGPPQSLQRRSFQAFNSEQQRTTDSNTNNNKNNNNKNVNKNNSASWSFFSIGSGRKKRKLPSGKENVSAFSCRNRPPGYYADMQLGCEVSCFWFPVKNRTFLVFVRSRTWHLRFLPGPFTSICINSGWITNNDKCPVVYWPEFRLFRL